jgi:hypothetical protein
MKRLFVLALLVALPLTANAQDMSPRASMATPAMRAAPAARPMPAPAMVRPMARAASKGPVMASPPTAMPAPMAKTKKAMAAPSGAVTAKKPSKLERATAWIERIGVILVALLTLIGGVLTLIKGADWRKGMKGKRWEKIQGYVDKAFDVVEGVAGFTSWKGDDKLVEYLKRIDAWLKGEGEKPLTSAEAEAVKLAAGDKAKMKKADG